MATIKHSGKNMNNPIQPLKRSDIPILIRWFRGNILFWGIIGVVMILRWLGDVSPINMDAMTDSWAKTALASLAGILTIVVTFFGLPLLLHELAFSAIAAPAIKATLKRQDDGGPAQHTALANQVVETGSDSLKR